MLRSILVVDDEVTLSKNIARYLSRSGYECRVATTGEDALECLDDYDPDAVILDYALPGKSGLEILREIRMQHPAIAVVFLTGHSGVQLAVDAMKAGADDYVNKPVALEELQLIVERIFRQKRTQDELDYYRRKEAQVAGLDTLCGGSPAMTELRRKIRVYLNAESKLVQGSPPPVLIVGETGTGKELVARAFHYDGTRSKGPFVEINCSAIPATLMEAELFGYERGAFTGAGQRKAGLVENADKGTLFLDEIGDMDVGLQAKLLGLLERHRFRRVGGLKDLPVDIRVIAATNRDLEDMASKGQFRSDLLYRLRVIGIVLPPLRERSGDAVELAQHFIKVQCKRYGREPATLNSGAVEAIKCYPWPGNVRELRNVIENAVLLVEGDAIEERHLAIPEQRPTSEIDDVDTTSISESALDESEIRLLIRALDENQWNISNTARVLGVSRDTLRYRIQKFGLSKHRKDRGS